MKQTSVKMDDDLFEYVDNLGENNFTQGLSRVVIEHREGKIMADLERGLEFLRLYCKKIEFRDEIAIE